MLGHIIKFCIFLRTTAHFQSCVADAHWPQQMRLSNCCQNIYLHGVVGVLVVKDKRFLDQLVVSFQLVNLWFVIHNAFLVLPQVVELVLQGPVHLY